MGTWTNIRTEKILGPYLSKSFQGFSHGPELYGEDCELHQIEKIMNIDLTPFTLRNYSGMWDESDFPPDHKRELIQKQIEEDKKWNDLSDFLILIETLTKALENKKISSNLLKNKFKWQFGYFDFDSTSANNDSFYNDLKTIKNFLIDAHSKGEEKAAFYVE